MIGYIKRKNVLSRIKEEMEFNWKMYENFGKLAETINDAASKLRHLDMQQEYLHRWEECARLYTIMSQTT